LLAIVGSHERANKQSKAKQSADPAGAGSGQGAPVYAGFELERLERSASGQ
jgi:hypothetical protein